MFFYFLIALCTMTPTLHAMNSASGRPPAMPSTTKLYTAEMKRAAQFHQIINRTISNDEATKLVSDLIDAGLNVNEIEVYEDGSYVTKSPLSMAIKTSCPGVANLLLEKGAQFCSHKNPELLEAALYAPSLLKKLLDQCTPDKDVLRQLLKSALVYPETVGLLLEYGAPVEGDQELARRAMSCAESVIAKLADRGMPVTVKNSADESFVHRALAQNYSSDLIAQLTRMGAPVNDSDYGGRLPLELTNDITHLQTLIQQGADPLKVGSNGRTPFDKSAQVCPPTQLFGLLLAATCKQLAKEQAETMQEFALLKQDVNQLMSLLKNRAGNNSAEQIALP